MWLHTHLTAHTAMNTLAVCNPSSCHDSIPVHSTSYISFRSVKRLQQDTSKTSRRYDAGMATNRIGMEWNGTGMEWNTGWTELMFATTFMGRTNRRTERYRQITSDSPLRRLGTSPSSVAPVHLGHHCLPQPHLATTAQTDTRRTNRPACQVHQSNGRQCTSSMDTTRLVLNLSLDLVQWYMNEKLQQAEWGRSYGWTIPWLYVATTPYTIHHTPHTIHHAHVHTLHQLHAMAIAPFHSIPIPFRCIPFFEERVGMRLEQKQAEDVVRWNSCAELWNRGMERRWNGMEWNGMTDTVPCCRRIDSSIAKVVFD